ncbi:MAG: hypothetical protein HFI38_07350 [Lachnospiraceae bacterium]|jgi:uncharacterized protein YxjI|nr:hypothetical protein [Lachnospiraceae bacterium]
MKLLIQQRVFSWTDSYDIYDEQGQVRYYVKAKFFSLGHELHIYDSEHHEIGVIKELVPALVPVFEIWVQGVALGRIKKQWTFFRPKYEIDFNGWHVEGDFMGWDYDVYDDSRGILHISKELLHWGDTYVIDIADPQDELMGLMLVIAIDAANCGE